MSKQQEKLLTEKYIRPMVKNMLKEITYGPSNDFVKELTKISRKYGVVISDAKLFSGNLKYPPNYELGHKEEDGTIKLWADFEFQE